MFYISATEESRERSLPFFFHKDGTTEKPKEILTAAVAHRGLAHVRAAVPRPRRDRGRRAAGPSGDHAGRLILVSELSEFTVFLFQPLFSIEVVRCVGSTPPL